MDYYNKPHDYYEKNRVEMLSYLPQDASRILEIGCGKGSFGILLKEQNSCEVWGIELMEEEANEALKVLDKVLIGKCEELIDGLPCNFFDAVYFNDVLEHLHDPYTVLKNIKSKLADKGVVISSIPNIRYHNEFKMYLFNKDWLYQYSGIMDFTHMRFFTAKSIKRMYLEAGYVIERHEGINRTKSLKPYLWNIVFLFTQLDVFYLQYATVASKP